MRGDNNTEQGDIVVKRIADLMAQGLRVYDANGETIGAVQRYDLDAAYMVVEEGWLAKREVYLPFHLIRSIDPHEIYLAVLKGALSDAYLLPPAARPLVEEQTYPDTGQTEDVITHEIRSGYDGHAVQVEPVHLDELKRSLAVGMTVVDVDGEYVGEVTHYDAARGLLTVRNTLTEDPVAFVPLSVVVGPDPALPGAGHQHPHGPSPLPQLLHLPVR